MKEKIKNCYKMIRKGIKDYKINPDDICVIYFYTNEPDETFPLWQLNAQIQTLNGDYNLMSFSEKNFDCNFKTTYNRLRKGDV